jgi:hypothetical protein
MLTVMTWNLENFERPAANAAEAAKERYSRKLTQISELITGAGPDLVGVREVLADSNDLIDQILVSHLLVHALDNTQSLPMDGIKSATADPRHWRTWKLPPTTGP